MSSSKKKSHPSVCSSRPRSFLQVELSPIIHQKFKERARKQFRSMRECIEILVEKFADGEIILEKNMIVSLPENK